MGCVSLAARAVPGGPSGKGSCGSISGVAGGARACQSPMTTRKSSASLEFGTERIRLAYAGPPERKPIYAPAAEKTVRLPYRRTGGSGGLPRRARKRVDFDQIVKKR